MDITVIFNSGIHRKVIGCSFDSGFIDQGIIETQANKGKVNDISVEGDAVSPCFGPRLYTRHRHQNRA